MTRQTLILAFQRTLLTASLLLSIPSLAKSDTVVTPADWLARMVEAANAKTYNGLMVYETTSGLSSMRVFRASTDGVAKERLIYQDGPYQEIIRRGDQVAFIRADGGVNRYGTDGVTGLVDRLSGYQDDLRASYRLMFGGDDRVAGREALRINVQPRDNHRYGYSLWLDRESGLLLRSELIGEEGAVLERFQYVDINFSDMPGQSLEPSRPVVWQTVPKQQANVPGYLN